MFLELHIIQNFAPSNLNRDDTGSPKSCDFGGYRRARISSQAIKRAIRTEFKANGLVPPGALAERSKRLRFEVAKALSDRHPERDAQNAFDAGLAVLGILSEERGDTEENDVRSEVLLFASHAQIAAVAAVCDRHWDELKELHATLWPAGKGKKPSKDAAKKLGTKDLKEELLQALDAARSSDQALFGRMLAELPNRNIDAASQVAHAISTHQVSAEFDYYTAVDDLKPEDTAGADMIGTIEFNSACYYRYANIDLRQLAKNLGGDGDLVEATVRAFLIASRDAIPTGKQNSFAARNAPSFVFSVVRDRGAWSLANSFVRPVRAAGETSLVEASIEALDRHWGELTGMYGEPDGARLAVATMGDPALPNLGRAKVANFNGLMERALDAVRTATVA
jgi:CRISPR system Cascade subunit CasC